MKVETNNSIPSSTPDTECRMPENRDFKYKHRAPSAGYRSSRYALDFFCLLVLACCLLVSLARAELSSAPRDAQAGEIAPADLTARDAERSSQNSLSDAPKPTSQVAHQLWQSRVSVPEDPEETKAKNELKHLIEQLRSVRFETNKQTPEYVVAMERVSKTEPNEGLPAAETPKQPVKTDVRPEPDRQPPYEPVSAQTLQVLEGLSQHPDQPHNPFYLAEVLFLSGHLKQAGLFYRQALRRISLDDVGSNEDRAWILFQTGNCLRDDDLTNAGEMYRQLIAEYPNSPWIDLAKARLNLIDWYQTSKPQALIAECKTEAAQPPGL